MDTYMRYLTELYGSLEINLVRHDTSSMGLPCYIEACLGAKPEDLGQTALDLGNYIHRTTGLTYQSTPEYRGRGKTTTLRWFMSWADVEPILPNIHGAFGKYTGAKHLPSEFRSLIIQNPKRGVMPKDAA